MLICNSGHRKTSLLKGCFSWWGRGCSIKGINISVSSASECITRNNEDCFGKYEVCAYIQSEDISVLCQFQLFLFVATYAKADVGLAYDYKPPSARIPSGSYIPSSPSVNYQTPLSSSGSSGVNTIQYPTGQQSLVYQQQQQPAQVVYQQQQQQPAQVVYQQQQQQQPAQVVYQQQPAQSSGSFQQQSFSPYVLNRFSGGSQQSTYTQQNYNLKPEVRKHVYFYEGPEEKITHTQRVHVPVVAPKKNYKIIFIKAPTYASASAPIIPAQQQDEEKTLVYVLVKKPEAPADITVQAPAPTQPTKPEVYFIKYKTQKEAEDKIAGTLQGTSSGVSVIANSFDTRGAFVDSIGRSDAAAAQQVKTTFVQHTVPSSSNVVSGAADFPVETRFSEESSVSSSQIASLPSVETSQTFNTVSVPQTVQTVEHSQTQTVSVPQTIQSVHVHEQHHVPEVQEQSHTVVRNNFGPPGESGPY